MVQEGSSGDASLTDDECPETECGRQHSMETVRDPFALSIRLPEWGDSKLAVVGGERHTPFRRRSRPGFRYVIVVRSVPTVHSIARQAVIFKRRDDAPSDDEEEEIEQVLFQGSTNGVEADLKGNAKLVQAGLVRAKELVSEAMSRRAEMIRLETKGQVAQALVCLSTVSLTPPVKCRRRRCSRSRRCSSCWRDSTSRSAISPRRAGSMPSTPRRSTS